ncbi:MAG: PspC domain-containing protein [Chitinophagaceae bacterium]
MKKIININLSGRVIPIEDLAFEKLQDYIDSLRRYFAQEEGRDEIINDIESRIAELMNDKVRKGAAAITEADVEEIIAGMGRPEDFDSIEADEKDQSGAGAGNQGSTGSGQYSSYTRSTGRGRLYRDSSDKFIGGVCSGIANYLNTDPAIVRILFAIVTFGGFGLGFLIYILLWAFLPTRDLESYGGKRLYRNPDDKMLGGVAGGLGAYFGVKSNTLRFILIAPTLFSVLISMLDWISWGHGFSLFPNIVFGSLSGTFFLAYIVLWMVLPEARTNYEKMEMRGEKVDVNRIRQNVQEGMGNVKDRMKNWGEEVKESAQQFGTKAREFADTRGRQFASEVGETARRSGWGIGHAIGVLFKAFFLFIAGVITFALFVTLIALLFGGIAWWPINNFMWTSNWQQMYAWGTLIFFLLVPLIGMITWIVRRVMRVKSRHSYLGWTFGALWTIGWVSVILLVSSLARDFSRSENVAEAVEMQQPSNGKLIVAVTEPELEYNGNFAWMNDEGTGWDLSPDTLRLSAVHFNIMKSIDSEYHVNIRKFSNGRTDESATERAQAIIYPVISKDSILDLANGFSISKESKYRGQQVQVEILVPVGKQIRFDESVRRKLHPFGPRIRVREGGRRYMDFDDWDDYYRYRFRSNVDYTMDQDGNLRDSAGRVLNRYSGNTYSPRENQYDRDNRRDDSGDNRGDDRRNRKDSSKESLEDDSEEGYATISSPGPLSLLRWN